MTTFNARFPYAVDEIFFSQRGNLVRREVVAAVADRETALKVYMAIKEANPERSFSFAQVC